MASKASQMHFALILVKGAEEAWGIDLIGQRLPSRNPVHHTRSKIASSTLSSRNNGSQPEWTNGKKKHWSLHFVVEKCNWKSEKCNNLCLKKSEKSEHFYVTHEHFLKKLALFCTFLAKNKHCFKHLMLFLRALSVRAYSGQGASKEPKNPCPEWILRSLIREILD